MRSCSYCSSARATSRNPAAEVLLRSRLHSYTEKITSCIEYKPSYRADTWVTLQEDPPSLLSALHLSVVLICSALLSILAPMSSMLFPLRSTFLRQVLLPRALTSMVPRERRRESERDRDCRAWRGRGRGGVSMKEAHVFKCAVGEFRNKWGRGRGGAWAVKRR